ncbi:MAG: hypothetical protein ACRDNT_30220 [Streptosporangiaceae bacterium]
MRKPFWTETIHRHYSDALDILGAEGVLAPDAANAPFGGTFKHDFWAAVVTTVYGGAKRSSGRSSPNGASACPATGPAAKRRPATHRNDVTLMRL